MTNHPLEDILAAPSPFEDAFSDDLLVQGEVVRTFPVWTECGRRIDLHARMLGWRPLCLWRVMEDAEATFTGLDDDGWEPDREGSSPIEAWINWRASRAS